MFPIHKDRLYVVDIEVKPLPQYESKKYYAKINEDDEGNEFHIDEPNFYPWFSEIYAISVAWGENYATESAYFDGADILTVVTILSEQKLRLAAHNVFYDWVNLYYHFNLPLNFVYDSGVVSQCINNSDFITSFGLKQTTERLYNVITQDFEIKDYLKDNFKIPASKYGAFIHLCPRELIEKYCRLDAHYCWRIINDSPKWLKCDITKYMQLYMCEVKSTILQFIEGILVDREGFKRELASLQKEIADIEDKFLNHEELVEYIALVQQSKFNKKQATLKTKKLDFEEWNNKESNKFNINSTKQLKDLFDFQKLHYNANKGAFEYPYVNTFTGSKVNNPNSPKLGTKFLHAYGTGGEILADKGEKNTLLQHIERALDESEYDGRVHAHINLLGTKSGRVSGSGVNIIATPIGEPQYGKYLIVEDGYTVICRDVCFFPTTEYLTQRGWVKILDLQETDKVWEVNPINLVGNFTKPLRIIKKDYEGVIYSYKSGQNRGCLKVTEGHRMFWVGQQTHKRKDKVNFRKWSLSQESVPTLGCNIATFSYSNLESNFTEEDIWLVAAIQADGSNNRDKGFRYEIQLNNPRKIEKLKSILGEPSFINKEIREGQNFHTHRWYFNFEHPLLNSGKEKIFNLNILGQNQAECFFEALLFWDGSYVGKQKYNTGRFQYGTTEPTNADNIQLFAVKNGYECRISSRVLPSGKNFYSLSIKKKGTIRFQPDALNSSCKIKKDFYKGQVGCVTVNTGLILVRNEGQTFLSGNCSLEPTLLACLSNDPVLKYATYEGEGKEPFIKDSILWIDDIYLMAAYSAPFMRIELEDKLDLTNWVKNSDTEKKKVKQLRSLSKTIVLATNYGAGTLKIQSQIRENLKLTIPLKNIQEFQDNYWMSLATAHQYKRRLEQIAQTQGYFVNIGGYPLTFYDRPGGRIDGTHKALNKMLQSSAAVVMKLINFYKYQLLKGRTDMIPLVCDWHDADFYKVKNESIEDYVLLTDKALEQVNNTLKLSLKLRLDFNKGRSFYDNK